LYGHVLIFTGELEKVSVPEAARIAAEMGCDVKDALPTEKTTRLVVGKQDPKN
jgi:hypothetical protein